MIFFSPKKNPYLWKFFLPYLPSYIVVTTSLLLQIALNIAFPVPTKVLFNDIIQGKADTIHNIQLLGLSFQQVTGMQALAILTAILAIICLLIILFSTLDVYVNTNIAYSASEEIRKDLFRKVFSRSQAYLDRNKKIDIMSRISADVANLMILMENGFSIIVRDIPMILILITAMFLVDVRITLMFIICVPAFFFIIRFFSLWLNRETRVWRRRSVAFEEVTYEAISSMSVIKSLRGEERLLTKLIERVIELTTLGHKMRNADLGLQQANNFSYYTIRAIFIAAGTWAIFAGLLKLGDLLQIFTYMEMVYRYSNNIVKFLTKFSKCKASMDRLEELDLELSKNPEISGIRELPTNLLENTKKSFEFKDVTFSYLESDNILTNYSFEYEKSKLITLVGQSGMGKSTFSRLLNRLNDPNSGEIKLAGIDLKDFKIQELRKFVRVISQDVFLISGTIRENLMLASSKILSDENLIEALQQTNAMEFIQTLPKGLDTLIGEGGIQLSGGQAKRIHLARAFLEDESKILVFDEPTTGLDTLSCEFILKAVKKLSKSKDLVFWITHRMQEVHHSDNVLFFVKNGNPIYSTHEELLKTSDLYRALMEQTGSSPKRKTKANEDTPLTQKETDEDIIDPVLPVLI
ncbi:MAG: ABC transporter ATP-binding protein/permease [Oligoflexia bacterium]|nr:ABC transporter ATP-binding protein/permease [Oligoflexia bacterium]